MNHNIMYWIARPLGDTARDFPLFFLDVMPLVFLVGIAAVSVSCRFVRRRPVGLYVFLACSLVTFCIVWCPVFPYTKHFVGLAFLICILAIITSVEAVVEAITRHLGRGSILLAVGAVLSSLSLYSIVAALAAGLCVVGNR